MPGSEMKNQQGAEAIASDPSMLVDEIIVFDEANGEAVPSGCNILVLADCVAPVILPHTAIIGLATWTVWDANAIGVSSSCLIPDVPSSSHTGARTTCVSVTLAPASCISRFPFMIMLPPFRLY